MQLPGHVSLWALQLGSVDSYGILSNSGCTSVDGMDDAARFERVKSAFDTIGMDAETQTQVGLGLGLRSWTRLKMRARPGW